MARQGHKKMDLFNIDWNLYYLQNENVIKEGFNPTKITDFNGRKSIKTKLPMCLEYALFKNKIIDDPFYSDNIYNIRYLENYHQWYYATFDSKIKNGKITFNGIDTFADIYINVKLIGSTDNMFIPFSFNIGELKEKENEIVVHVYPTMIKAREFYIPAMAFCQKYNYPSIVVRKSASSFGWDILPRILCGGIYRNITLESIKEEKINEFYLYTKCIGENSAEIVLYYNFKAVKDDLSKYKIVVSGKCDEKTFNHEFTPWFTMGNENFTIENPELWFPKNYGKPNLYDTTITLKYENSVIDTKNLQFGIRTVRLIRTATATEENAKFEFNINNKKIFIMGTNWVPVDSYHINDIEYTKKVIKLVDEIGCNCIRIWGGGVYENEILFDYCDKHGILIWQDFMMGCGIYPNTKEFNENLTKEVEFVVKKYRNHPSLALWAGDNEGDMAHGWYNVKLDDNYYATRVLIKNVLENHDKIRPYLPSSPFYEGVSLEDNYILSENHLWGPRDYFKGEYYKNSPSLFASETGYHGLVSPKSADKFLKNKEKMFINEGVATSEYNAHATSPSNDKNEPFNYRTKLLYDQIKTLFTNDFNDYNSLSMASQISQAEADKYFIERFRLNLSRAGGIIWWNIFDGWPQVSDAIIDNYFTKKLAYFYIKRSQNDITFICDEDEKEIKVYLSNLTDKNIEINYKITNVYEGKVVYSGNGKCNKYSNNLVYSFNKEKIDKNFYFIEWEVNGVKYSNHFHSNIINIDFNKYIDALKKCKYYMFEGF